ncbi:MAG: hypothetical protein IIB44_12700 [Candidatus Marinimicrobia bacterium]|nr:hypothetical protein [Candidatus Neomarinimicrobiota bacterium]
MQTGYDFKNLYSPSKRYNENRTAYYHALQSVEKNQGDLTQWIKFALGGMVNELRSVEKKAELEYRKAIYTQLGDEFKLNNRQNWLLQQLAKSGIVFFTDYKKQFADKADRTLRKDIENLLKDKLIIEDGTKQKRLFKPNLYWDENRHYEG